MAVSLPDDISYTMPASPTAAVPWRLDSARCVVLIHDMQRHFIAPFRRSVDPAAALTANLSRLRDWANAAAVPVYYSAQPADQPPARRGLLTDFWGPGMTGNPRAAEIIPELQPAPDDTVLTKWRYSAFEQTDLERRLHEAGRDQLLIGGVYAHIGVAATAAAAFMRDLQPFVVADACADFGHREHAGALEWVAARCGRVITTGEALKDLTVGKA